MFFALLKLRFLQWLKHPHFVIFAFLLPLLANQIISEILIDKNTNKSLPIAIVLSDSYLNNSFKDSLSNNSDIDIQFLSFDNALVKLKNEDLVAIYKFSDSLTNLFDNNLLENSISVYHLPYETNIMGLNDIISNHLLEIYLPYKAKNELEKNFDENSKVIFDTHFNKLKESYSLNIVSHFNNFKHKDNSLSLKKSSVLSFSILFFQFALLFFIYFRICEYENSSYKRLKSIGKSTIYLFLVDAIFITLIGIILAILQLFIFNQKLTIFTIPKLILIYFSASCFLLLLSTIFNKKSFLRISPFIILLRGLLGGSIISSELFPPLLKKISYLDVTYWQNQSIKSIFSLNFYWSYNETIIICFIAIYIILYLLISYNKANK